MNTLRLLVRSLVNGSSVDCHRRRLRAETSPERTTPFMTVRSVLSSYLHSYFPSLHRALPLYTFYDLYAVHPGHVLFALFSRAHPAPPLFHLLLLAHTRARACVIPFFAPTLLPFPYCTHPRILPPEWQRSCDFETITRTARAHASFVSGWEDDTTLNGQGGGGNEEEEGTSFSLRDLIHALGASSRARTRGGFFPLLRPALWLRAGSGMTRAVDALGRRSVSIGGRWALPRRGRGCVLAIRASALPPIPFRLSRLTVSFLFAHAELYVRALIHEARCTAPPHLLLPALTKCPVSWVRVRFRRRLREFCCRPRLRRPPPDDTQPTLTRSPLTRAEYMSARHHCACTYCSRGGTSSSLFTYAASLLLGCLFSHAIPFFSRLPSFSAPDLLFTDFLRSPLKNARQPSTPRTHTIYWRQHWLRVRRARGKGGKKC
ncbi:hypothetical protein B0H16DRAFT_1883057 [Mycena metata]|uniref:Uncharacterized protein n=1 Tax=Mycena metata TaxID=1033252 RepID=A0AAD7NLT9_9AGAR|nr:hypothetical protein B0H16DRAFT_1883057 [Mycena metata]